MDGLRARTEKFLAAKEPKLEQRHWDDARKLVQELQAHQIDLESQNEALRQSAALYRLIVETANEGVWGIDADYRTTYVNPVMAEMLGYRAEEMLGRPVSDFIFPEDQSDYQDKMAQLRQGLDGTNERRLKRQDDSELWASISTRSLAEDQGRFQGSFAMLTDTTHHKQAEEALAQQAQFLQVLIDTIPTPIFYKDAEGRYLGCNQAFHDFYGFSKDQIMGKTVDSLGPQKLVEKHRQMDLKLLQDPGVQSYECRTLRGDCSKREVVIDKATFLKADGTVGGLIGVQTDVTEFKEAQRELRALAARLAEVEEAERHHLARELHDEVGQGLTALGLTLTLLKTQMPQETAASLLNRLADAVVLVEKTGETIRNVMTELRPPVLDDYGLLSALRWYGAEFSRRTGIGVDVQGEEASPRLARPVELALFRIAQEALTNVVKHAGASRVEVTEKLTQ